ncbi:MAG TPA: hypothetical protein VIM87_19130 [Chitinophaga sp.]|uniref:hypothetical protein n=1 Tax=Chitinophaga sp. TaxID=1869181 RepID=UPI002F91DEE4
MAQYDPKEKEKDLKGKPQDSNLKPDPGTTGAEPQEHMEGPVSSIVKKVGQVMDDNDQEEGADKSTAEKIDEE